LDLIVEQYLDIIAKNSAEGTEPAVLAASADMNLLKAIITFYSKWESIYDGAWEDAAKGGIFLKLLYRLRELA